MNFGVQNHEKLGKSIDFSIFFLITKKAKKNQKLFLRKIVLAFLGPSKVQKIAPKISKIIFFLVGKKSFFLNLKKGASYLILSIMAEKRYRFLQVIALSIMLSAVQGESWSG